MSEHQTSTPKEPLHPLARKSSEDDLPPVNCDFPQSLDQAGKRGDNVPSDAWIITAKTNVECVFHRHTTTAMLVHLHFAISPDLKTRDVEI